MSACCVNSPDCAAKTKLRAWLAAGAKGWLILHKEDFPDGQFSLTVLLFSGSLRERLTQRWRSFCALMGRYTPFSSWKEFWFRRAGANIGKNVYFSQGAEIDLLFPQLITLEDEAVMGMGALIVAHVYTPDRIALARATVKRGGLVGGRAVLGLTSIGEEGVLAACSYTVKPVPDGYTAIGVPAALHKRKVCATKTVRTEEGENDEYP